MSTLTARQGPKSIKHWTARLNQIPDSAISTGDIQVSRQDILRVDQCPAPAGTRDKYLIGVQEQRLLNEHAARKLRASYDLAAPHMTTELVLCRTTDDPLNIRVPDGQTRLLAMLLGVDPGPKTFRFVMYEGVTPKDMVALFEFYGYRRDTSTQDKLSLYRSMSPVYQHTQEPDEQTNQVFRVVLERNRRAVGPPRITWAEMLAGWMLGSNGNGVVSAKQQMLLGKVPSTSGYNTDQAIRLFIHPVGGVQAYQDTEKLVASVQMAAHLSHPVLTKDPQAKGLRLSDIGKQLSAMMPTYKADLHQPLWQEALCHPKRRVSSNFWSFPMLRILHCLVHHNGWDLFLRRLPWLMREMGAIEAMGTPTNATAPGLVDLIEAAINFNARGGGLRFPSAVVACPHPIEIQERSLP